MRKRIFRRNFAAVLAGILLLTLLYIPVFEVHADQTYTVTANLSVPGELNTQLPGVTAYMTNGNNPLGLGGYAAKAPTEPVSANAKLTLSDDGTLTLSLPVPNPVFTLQEIGSSSNASVTKKTKDNSVYTSTDGKASRTGRITHLTIKLKDRSGTYIFNNCIEFPTLLGVDWTVPLTLQVDLSAVPEAAAAGSSSASSVNYDSLSAMIGTVEKALEETAVSSDGSDVETSEVWVSESESDALKAALKKAKQALSGGTQSSADQQTAALRTAYEKFTGAQKSGSAEQSEHLGKTLAPGTYTISANIWFNKADTGLPLNPHITNSTFPPMNPVEGNAVLTIAEDGSAKAEIPIVIKDQVMTVRRIDGLKLLKSETDETGAVTNITVDLGKLSGDSTVVTQQSEEMTAEIWMGDLAMSISGLSKEHVWPYTFQLNLSGVDTTDGGKMPVVALEMMDASAASAAMASVGAGETEEPEKETSAAATAAVAAVLLLAAAAAIIFAYLRRRKNSAAEVKKAEKNPQILKRGRKAEQGKTDERGRG